MLASRSVLRGARRCCPPCGSDGRDGNEETLRGFGEQAKARPCAVRGPCQKEESRRCLSEQRSRVFQDLRCPMSLGAWEKKKQLSADFRERWPEQRNRSEASNRPFAAPTCSGCRFGEANTRQHRPLEGLANASKPLVAVQVVRRIMYRCTYGRRRKFLSTAQDSSLLYV